MKVKNMNFHEKHENLIFHKSESLTMQKVYSKALKHSVSDLLVYFQLQAKQLFYQNQRRKVQIQKLLVRQASNYLVQFKPLICRLT